jgi:low affinity Fe/Cu permease
VYYTKNDITIFAYIINPITLQRGVPLPFNVICEKLAKKVTTWAGSTNATILAFALIISWTIGGLFEGFSDSYQMIINTGTTIITFLMVFLIQRTQNKDSTAIQLKLNELIASVDGSSNRLLNIEDLSESDIEILRKRYRSLALRTKSDDNFTSRHTIEEIE